jgi:fatty-acyl-CoA synthase
MEWNLADLFELVADTAPDRLALAHGPDGAGRSWAMLERRANALAQHLLRNHAPGDKLAIYAANRPEYLEAFVAAVKARLVPVNVNYRYLEEELTYILDNSDSTAVIFEARFAERVARLRDRLSRVREWIEVEETAPCSEFAIPYEEVVAGGAERPLIRRTPEDLVLLYTGGTTGMPKGVMWEQKALWRALGGGGNVLVGEKPSESIQQQRARIEELERAQQLLTASPLMHGTGLCTAIQALGNGGAVVTLTSRSLDPEALWSSVEARRANVIAIVGDPFARPMLDALEAHPERWNLESCRLIISSGAMWSPEIKKRLLRHLPRAVLLDSFGSSEALGFGIEITTKDTQVQIGQFRIGPNCKVFTCEGKEVEPGSDEAGFVARSGPIPLGYYRDEKKTAETFKFIDGRRWSIPGDWCKVNEDGSLRLLGRGSVCINTGGEKVYPEEVEETLKTHPAVVDAVVVGVPSQRWGEAVVAVVKLEDGARTSEEGLRAHVRRHLAAYKTPKHVVFVGDVGRAPSGKADYQRARACALEALKLNLPAGEAD